MTIINAWPLLFVLVVWLYKARIDKFYQAHLNLFDNVWLNVAVIFLYSTIMLFTFTQFKITWQATVVLVTVNIFCDLYLITNQRK
mgnify:FL=1